MGYGADYLLISMHPHIYGTEFLTNIVVTELILRTFRLQNQSQTASFQIYM